MNNGAPVSMIEPRTHVSRPHGHDRKIFFIIVAIFVVLAIGLMVAAYLSSNKSPEPIEDIVNDSDDTEIVVAEIVIDNTEIGSAFWEAANNNIGASTVRRSDCEELIKYGNRYVDAFGGTKINNNVCQEKNLKIAGEQTSSNEYPYDDLMVIYFQAGDKCIVAPFYDGFYGIQNYKVTNGQCSQTMKAVGVMNE